MKVITNKVGGLSINPQTILYFKQGDVFEAGIKQLTETNIARLVELGFADVVEESAEAVVETTSTESTEVILEAEIKTPDAYDFEAIADKQELTEYAKEIYGIELDASQSLKKMIAALKAEVEKEGE